MKTVVTIAGSDCSGGAGIQADLKTMMAHKVYGMSVITALTAQNTMEVAGIMEVAPEFVASQMDAIFTDIPPDAVKIGMVSSEAIIYTIAKKLREYKVQHLVVDPVMVATSGSKLLCEEAREALIGELLPLADLITPNLAEASVLCGMEISCKEQMIEAAERINKATKTNVLIKGGHLEDCADDLLYCEGKVHWFSGKRVDNPNTHGTGCTLSSAIASNLALGYSMVDSIKKAKSYITGALQSGLDLGKGSGPLNHCYNIM